MSNSDYRGDYRERERDNSFRGRDSREAGWNGSRPEPSREREYDRDGRRDTRLDDSRRRYDHAALDRPLGALYDGRGPPSRNYDSRQPLPSRRRDDRGFDRRYPAPYDTRDVRATDIPRGPRSRRTSWSRSPPRPPMYGRSSFDATRETRRRSRSPSSTSSRRPRSPSRRLPSPEPLLIDREKVHKSIAIKSPLESGEERTETPSTGRTTSSSTSLSGASFSIRGSAQAISSARPLDARTVAAQRASSKPPSQDTSGDTPTQEIGVAKLTDSAHGEARQANPSPKAEVHDAPVPVQARAPSPAAPRPPAIPTGPKAMQGNYQPRRDRPPPVGPSGYNQGRDFSSNQQASRGFGRGYNPAGNPASGSGTYAGRSSSRDERAQQPPSPPTQPSTRTYEPHNKGFSSWDETVWAEPTSSAPAPVVAATPAPLAATKPVETGTSSLASEPMKISASTEAPKPIGPSSTPAMGEAVGSPRWGATVADRVDSAKQSPQATTHGAWGNSSPATWDSKESQGWVGQGASSPAMQQQSRDGKTNWGDSPSHTPQHLNDRFSGRGGGGFRGQGRRGQWGGHRGSYNGQSAPTRGYSGNEQRDDPQPTSPVKEEGKLKQPWMLYVEQAEEFRVKRHSTLDAACVAAAAASRKALRDLELLHGEIAAANLNRALRKEHLDSFKETFMGTFASGGDVTMI